MIKRILTSQQTRFWLFFFVAYMKKKPNLERLSRIQPNTDVLFEVMFTSLSEELKAADYCTFMECYQK